MKGIAKDHLVSSHFIPEMVVFKLGVLVGQPGQFQVVGRNQAHASLADQALEIGPATDKPFPVIGAPKNFIYKKEER